MRVRLPLYEPASIAMADAANKSNVQIARMTDGVPCRSGCNHCCSRQISVSLAEAVVIREYLEKHGKWRDVETRAKSVEKISLEIDPITWFTMNIKCPVLNPETGTCEAYPARPPTCSTHFVLSDPSSCDPWSTERARYVPLDLHDVFQDFAKSLERRYGKNVASASLPLPSALLVSRRLTSRSGLTVDDAITTVARNS